MEIMLIDSPHAIMQLPSSLMGEGNKNKRISDLPLELKKNKNEMISQQTIYWQLKRFGTKLFLKTKLHINIQAVSQGFSVADLGC